MTLTVTSTPLEAANPFSKRKVEGHETDPTCLYTTKCGITCWVLPHMDWCQNSMIAVCTALSQATYPPSKNTGYLYITGNSTDDGNEANCAAVARISPDATTAVDYNDCLQNFYGLGGYDNTQHTDADGNIDYGPNCVSGTINENLCNTTTGSYKNSKLLPYALDPPKKFGLNLNSNPPPKPGDGGSAPPQAVTYGTSRGPGGGGRGGRGGGIGTGYGGTDPG